jgi:ABC-type transporter Mla subunit MlaD
VTATEQVSQAMRDVRGGIREITQVLAAQTKTAAANAADLAIVVREVAAVRGANAEQAEQIATLSRGGAGAGAGEPTA